MDSNGSFDYIEQELEYKLVLEQMPGPEKAWTGTGAAARTRTAGAEARAGDEVVAGIGT